MTESYPLFGRYTSDTKPAPEGAAGRVAPGAGMQTIEAAEAKLAAGAAVQPDPVVPTRQEDLAKLAAVQDAAEGARFARYSSSQIELAKSEATS